MLLLSVGVFLDQAAQAFGAAFYHALIIGGYTVQGAFDIAMNLVNASGRDPQGDNFLLLPEGVLRMDVIGRVAFSLVYTIVLSILSAMNVFTSLSNSSYECVS